jgi:Family of unknown function (DUF5946)
MQDLIDYATKNGITLLKEGACQFCGANVSGGVFECHENSYRVAALLDFNNPAFYLTRFLSVDAMALQHCEIHGPWNNHIHLTRLFLIFEKGISWDYSKTPQLSQVINQYKKNRKESLTPPPVMKRGELTTLDLINANTPDECVDMVRRWARGVYDSFHIHHPLVSSIAGIFIEKHYL